MRLVGKPPKGDKLMFWSRVGVIAVDGLAILAGLAISTPFFLVLFSPFVGGL